MDPLASAQEQTLVRQQRVRQGSVPAAGRQAGADLVYRLAPVGAAESTPNTNHRKGSEQSSHDKTCTLHKNGSGPCYIYFTTIKKCLTV